MRLLTLVALLATVACADSSGRAEAEALDPTARMVERLSDLANGLDRRQSPFNNEARVAVLKARGAGEGLQAQMTFRGQLAEQLLYAGRFEEAADSLRSLLAEIDRQGPRVPPEFRTVIANLEASTLFKWEEQEGCVDSGEVEGCTVGLSRTAPRPDAAPGRRAVAVLERLLEADPSSLQNRWLLNVGYMMLGEHPEGVPERWRVTPDAIAAEADVGRFVDRAGELGIDDIGHAGGAIMDDFNGDGALDVMTSSWLLEDQMKLYLSDGAGGFVDHTDAGGLTGLVGGLNMKQADYDNDGDLDVLVLRGAWLTFGHPNSLLRNRGDGSFEDVTEAAGLLDSYSTQTADWGDYDNDGNLDLYVGNESNPRRQDPNQLFRNNGDGTFTEVARDVGAHVVGFTKGVVWGDYDNDGDEDLYISILGGSSLGTTNVLLRNDSGRDGGRVFIDVTEEAGADGPVPSFPVWFWDYDNDGWLDLYVSGYRATVGDVLAELLGQPNEGETPRLYRNRRDGTFQDVASDAALDRIQYVMGSNYGDLDSDGFDDFYVATGDPAYESVMANRVFRNNGGADFAEVTASGGFGLFLKGHAVSFGDADNDGDQDILVNMGGATQADRARNVFYENPGHGNRWVTLRLEGRTSNRSAIGARVRVTVEGAGAERSFHRRVGSGGSFGANSLQLEVGLGEATRIVEVAVRWPTSGTEQTFTDVALDAVYRIVEGDDAIRPDPAPTFSLGGPDPGR